MDYKIIENCRACGRNEFTNILNLGYQYIANAFYAEGNPPTLKAPLKLIKCSTCDLVQLKHSIDPNLMYRNYWYRSGINQSMKTHLQELVISVMDKVVLGKHDIVIDIACNDGTLLGFYPRCVTKIGVDPSNIKPSNCDHFIHDYFSYEPVKYCLRYKKAKAITSIAMFYDLNKPKEFIQEVRKCLDDNGVWCLELSYLPRMLENVAFDSICHEHLCYYSLKTFEGLLRDIDLEIFDVSFNDMNGSSFRLFLAPCGTQKINPGVIHAFNKETEFFGVQDQYWNFADDVENRAQALISFVNAQKSLGKKVFGIGASTKGQILLQYCNFNSNDIEAIAERNPDKHGLFTPGTSIPICSEEELRLSKPDYAIVFPYHFKDEIIEREKALRGAGTKLVFPLPELEII